MPFEHNWGRSHPALRGKAEGLPGGRHYQQRGPARAIGLTDHIRTWGEFLTFGINHHQRE